MARDLPQLFQRAKALYEQGEDLEEAKRLFQECVRDYPDALETRYAKHYIGLINGGVSASEDPNEEGPGLNLDPQMNRLLSSAWTWFYKFAFPTLWIGGFTLGTLAVFLAPGAIEGAEPQESRLTFLTIYIMGVLFIYWSCMRLKQVHLINDKMVISNYGRTIEVPLQDIERVSGSILMTPELIWLHFRRPTDFGSKVVFMAPWRFFAGLTPHPLVEQLQELLTKKR